MLAIDIQSECYIQFIQHSDQTILECKFAFRKFYGRDPTPFQYAFGLICFMVFDATFNNISAISWWSVLLVEETGVRGENNRPVASH